MARIENDPNYTVVTFPRATAATDLFKKEDVQKLAEAMSGHDHSTGKGLPMGATSIPDGSITSAKIVDGTIVAGDIADGAITSAKILDGTIAAVDLADAAVTNAKLGTDTARANLLTNGGFEIWQRGNGPFAGPIMGADRWGQSQAGTDTLSVSKETSNVDSVLGSRAAAGCTFTLGSGGGLSALVQNIAAADGVQVANRAVTASVRVRVATANAVRLAIYNGSTYAYSSFHTGDATWQTLSVTATIVGGYTVAQVLVYFAATCTAQVDNAMLVVGSVAADYAPLHPADDLARCLRYYETVKPQPGLYSYFQYLGGAGGWITQYPFKTPKGVTPTVTKVGTWTTLNCGQPGANGIQLDGFGLQTAVTAAGNFGFYPADATGFFTIESNP